MAESSPKRILLVATSAKEYNGHKTGLWLEELAAPYYTFQEAGYDCTVASIEGGEITIDAGSMDGAFYTEEAKKFYEDEQMNLTSSVVASAEKPEDYAAIFFCGGHGTCVDFPESGDLVMQWWNADKVVAAVCHGPTVLYNAMIDDQTPLVKGKKVTCFSNEEEKMVQGDAAWLPTSEWPETYLTNMGADFVAGGAWGPHSVIDGRLVTGQNPGSSTLCAQNTLRALGETVEVSA